MPVDFKALLNRPVTDFDRPIPLPAGTYHGTVISYEYGESNVKKTPFCRLHVRVTSPDESVPPEQLEGTKLPREMRRDFFLTDDALYRLKEFLASCGVDVQSGRPFSEAIADVIQQPVIVEITQRNGQDNGQTVIYNDISSISGTANK